MNLCFTELNFGLNPNNRLFEDCKTFDYGHVDVGRREGKGARTDDDVAVKATFRQHRVSLNYFKDEPILALIQEFNLIPKILLIEPGHIYNWHRDTYRATAFNLMLTNDDQYLVMFAHEHPTNSFMPPEYIYFPYTSIRYNYNQFYLLNTQIPHNSINYGTVPRYVLSMGYYELDPIRLKRGITYDHYYTTIDKLKTKNLINDASSNPNN